MSTKEKRVSGTTRACRGATFARTSDTIEFAFPFSTTKETKRERETCASYGASSYALTFLVSDFASPPGKSFSPIEIRKHAKERKKERKNDERSFYIVLMNDAHICRLRECIIARAVLSVSRSSSSRDGRLDAENDFVQIPS